MAKNVKWDFTNKCNLRCIHCMVGMGSKNSSFAWNTKRLTIDEKLSIVDNLVAADVKAITFLGGEPLTSKHIFHVTHYAASKGIAVTLVTNGILLNDHNIDKIIDSKIKAVTVSIDGASSTTHDQVRGRGSFDKTVANVGRMALRVKQLQSGLKIKVNHVVNKINCVEIDDMFELCRRLEVNELSFLALSDVGNATDHEDQLVLTSAEIIDAAIAIGRKFQSIDIMDYPKITQQIAYPLVCDYLRQAYNIGMPNSNITTICCFASISLGYVTPDGYLFPCDRIVPQKYKSIRGSVVERKSLLTHSFDEIWNSSYFAKTFELVMLDDTYKSFDPCSSCRYLATRQCNPCPLGSIGEGLSLGPCRIAATYLRRRQSSEEDSDTVASDNILSGLSTYRVSTEFLSDSDYEDIIDSIPEVSPDIRFIDKSDGTTIIFNPKKTEFCRLDAVKRYMLQLSSGENSVREIARQIQDVICAVRERIGLEDSGNLSSDDIYRRVGASFKNLGEAGFVFLKAEQSECRGPRTNELPVRTTIVE